MKQFIIPNTLKVGEHYSNDQIKYALEVANLGGIRPKIKDDQLDFIVLITSAEENKNTIRNPYADKIEGDILTYTGAGLKGDQEISGVNKRLIEQIEKQIFVNLGAKVKIEVTGKNDEFMIVGTLEANPNLGMISNECPVGKALLGHKVGDEITISSPIKTTYKIKGIKYEIS